MGDIEDLRGKGYWIVVRYCYCLYLRFCNNLILLETIQNMNKLIEYDLKLLETLPGLLSVCPRKCLYAFINESDKRIQIYKTSNFLFHISRLFNEIENLNNREIRNDLSKIKLLILETEFNSDIQMNIKYRNLVNRYSNNGYIFYKDSSIVNYCIKESFRRRNGKMYYVIELENTRGDCILLGVFRSSYDAKSFINSNYGNGVVDIIVSDNDITKMWLSGNK